MGWFKKLKNAIIYSAWDNFLISSDTALKFSDYDTEPEKPNNSEKQIVSLFMTQIDVAIGEEYLKYNVVYNLRQETLKQLKSAYEESPQTLIDFSNSIDHRLWALKQMAHLTFEEIGTGRYHLQDYLKPEGQILAKVNRMCLQKAFYFHYIDKAEYEKALKDLDELIHDVGTWA